MMKKLIAHLVLSDETGCLAFTATGCDIFFLAVCIAQKVKYNPELYQGSLTRNKIKCI